MQQLPACGPRHAAPLFRAAICAHQMLQDEQHAQTSDRVVAGSASVECGSNS